MCGRTGTGRASLSVPELLYQPGREGLITITLIDLTPVPFTALNCAHPLKCAPGLDARSTSRFTW